MWFADVGLVLAGVAAAGWLLGFVLVLAGRRASPSWTPLLVGTGAAVALFAAQAGTVDEVAHQPGPGVVDQSVLAWFVAHRAGGATVAMAAVSAVGGTVGMAVLAALAAGVLWWAGRRAQAGIVVVAAVGAALLVTGFKSLYGRARPPVADRLAVVGNAALPSGHALGSMVVLGVLAAVVVLVARRAAPKAVAVAASAVAIATIGASRLYLGVHWATDVLTGWLLGGAWLALCVTALVLADRRRGGSDSPLWPAETTCNPNDHINQGDRVYRR